MERFIKDFKKYWGYAVYSAKSELKSEVANSYLNWLWWVLDPICFMLIYVFIFGVVFKAREPYFPVFIFLGLSMWDFFNKNLKMSVTLVKRNKPIVSKVYLPKYILVVVKMLVNGFKMGVSLLIVAAMMVFWQVPLTWNILYFFPIMIVLWIFTFGCSSFMLHYGVFVEDLSNVINIILRLVFYMTGIFYNVATRLPAPYNEYAVKYNPLAFLLTEMRNAVIYGRIPNRNLLLVWFAVSLLLCILGIRKVYKNENSYVKVI